MEEVEAYKPNLLRKRQRRSRGQDRAKRQRYYRQNKNKIKRQQKQRQRKYKRSPRYKAQRKRQRREKRLRRRVASAWLLARSFRNTVPSNLTSVAVADNLPLSMREFDSWMKNLCRPAQGSYEPDKGDLTFPTPNGPKTFRVLYRILPDGQVRFDVIQTQGGRLNPNSRFNKFFLGPMENTDEMFKGFLQWLRTLVKAVRMFQRTPLKQ